MARAFKSQDDTGMALLQNPVDMSGNHFSATVNNTQMPALPVLGSEWPPPQMSPVAHTMTLWNAWWNGDPHILSWVYFNLGENSPVGRSFFATTGEKNTTAGPKPGQYRGGLLGGVDYTFWGTPVPPGEKRQKVHVPVAKRIARTSANQLFQKPPRITSSTGNAKNQAFFDQLLEGGLGQVLLEAAEMCAALGGVYLKVQWNEDISDMPWIQAIPADMGFPEFVSNKLCAVTFFENVDARDTDDTIRHLEKHHIPSNSVLHGIYQGNEGNLGVQMPIDTFPTMAAFAGADYYGMAENQMGYQINLPDLPQDFSSVVYVPNMKPNNLWRDLGHDATQLGVSDFSGVEQLMDQLDETYSELRVEMQLTRTRLMVPEEFLDNLGKGKGAVFEPQRQVYVPMAGLHGEDGNPIEAVQLDIKYQELLGIAADLYEQIVNGAGYSVQTFGDYTGPAPTATEVKAREKQTTITRAAKIALWTPALKDVIYSLMWVAANYFGADITPERPNIEFAEVSESDTFQNATAAAALNASGGASLNTIIQTIHPDWTADQIAAERQAILDDRAAGLTPMTAPPAPVAPMPINRLVSYGTKFEGEDVT